jgi:hypothetical protein
MPLASLWRRPDDTPAKEHSGRLADIDFVALDGRRHMSPKIGELGFRNKCASKKNEEVGVY